MGGMNMMGLGIVLTLRDLASAGIDKLRQKMTGFSAATQDMVKNFNEGAKNILGGFASIVIGFKTFGVMQKTFAASINTAANFEQAMARVKAVSGATGEDFKALSEQAEQLGRDTQFSASQAANAQELLARAGFQTNEILATMPALLDMAAAEGMDLANASDIAASAIRGFGLEAAESGRVADVLAKTSAASNTSIAALGESLKYVAPYAKAVGVDIEQTNAMLGVMANAGIKGSQAGNALKAAFVKLSEEPKRTAQALESLGVTAKTSTGDLRPLPELMKDLAEKTKGMGKADRLGVLNKIFGSIAGGGMLAVMDGVANGSLPELEEALYKASGSAKTMAEIMNDTAQGAMKRLESASEGLRIAIGNHLLPIYTKVINKIAEFKGWLTKLIKEHPVLSKVIIGTVTSLVTLVSATLIAIGTLMTIGGAIKLWGNLQPVISKLFKNILSNIKVAKTALGGMITPVLSFIALAGVMYYAYKKNLGGIRDMVEAISEGFTFALNADDKGIVEIEESTIERLKKNGNLDNAINMGMLFYRFREFWHGIEDGATTAINGIKDALKDVVTWLDKTFTDWFGENNFFSDFLKMFKPESDVKDWKEWGKIIGTAITSFLALALAIKGVAIALTILNSPLFVILGTVMLLVKYWDKWQNMVENFWDTWGGLAPKQQNISPEEFKKNYEKIGYEFDANDKIIKYPESMKRDPLKDNQILSIEAELARSRQNQRYKPIDINEAQQLMQKGSSTNTIPKITDVSKFAGLTPRQNWRDNVESSGSLALQSVLSPNANALQQNSMPTTTPVVVMPKALTSKKANNDELAKELIRRGGVNPDEITADDILSRANSAFSFTDTSDSDKLLNQAIKDVANVLSGGEQQVQNTMPVSAKPPEIIPFSPTAEINVTNPLGENVILSINELTSSLNVLGGDINGLNNTLSAFEPEVKVSSADNREDKSAPILVQHAQNQATMNGAATVQAVQQSQENIIKVDNKFDVKITGQPVKVNIDGREVAEVTMRYVEQHTERQGGGG